MSSDQATSSDGEAVDGADAAAAEAKQERSDTIELIATVVLAIATVLTAWSAFQATKWSGVQANSYASAGAMRTESAKASTEVGQRSIVQVGLFQQWVNAVMSEPGWEDDFQDGAYVPREGTEAAFVYSLFPEPLLAPFDEWIALRIEQGTDGPRSPFDVDSYELPGASEAAQLTADAESLSETARQANQRSDNYVLLTVLFASALFFAGVGSKLNTLRAKYLALGASTFIIAAGCVLLLVFPIEI